MYNNNCDKDETIKGEINMKQLGRKRKPFYNDNIRSLEEVLTHSVANNVLKGQLRIDCLDYLERKERFGECDLDFENKMLYIINHVIIHDIDTGRFINSDVILNVRNSKEAQTEDRESALINLIKWLKKKEK